MNKKLKTALGIAILVFLAFIAIYAFIPQESSLFQITDDLSLLIWIGASISVLLTFKLLGWKPKEGKVWFFLALGLFIWALGEIIWLYGGSLLALQQRATVSDLVALVGYIPVLIGFWIEFNIINKALHKNDIVKSALLTLIVAAISAYFIIIPVITAVNYSFLAKTIFSLFQLGDVLVIFFALVFFFEIDGGKLAKSWLMIAIAMAFGAIASISHAYLNWNDLYVGIPLVVTQLLWIIDYILLAFAAYYHRFILKGAI